MCIEACGARPEAFAQGEWGERCLRREEENVHVNYVWVICYQEERVAPRCDACGEEVTRAHAHV